MLDLSAFLPHDADAARSEDLARRQTAPPAPATLSAAPHAWPGEDPAFAPLHYIGVGLTPAEFRDYCLAYDFGSVPPSYWIWHHTVNPDASWAPMSSNQATWWDRNEQGMTLAQKKTKRKGQLDAIARYYIGLGWTTCPHLFVDDIWVWLACPMYFIAIHANEGNSYTKSGKTRYSIGCEVVGFYDRATWSPAVRATAGWAFACVKQRLNIQIVYTSAPQDRPDLHDPQLSGHRDYTTEKTCPGTAITPEFYVQAAHDGWAAYQANTPPGQAPADPLRARTLPGAPGTPACYCSVRAHDFYVARGGLPFCGYPLRDEFHDAELDCDAFPCERAAIKESSQYGVEQALIQEAVRQGWYD